MSIVYMLIGVPAAGKSTWISSQKFDGSTVVFSSDNHIESYAKSLNKTYNDVFKQYANTATQLMMQDLKDAIKDGYDIVWDQTNTTATSRRKKLQKIPQHYKKIAVVFSTPSND